MTGPPAEVVWKVPGDKPRPQASSGSGSGGNKEVVTSEVVTTTTIPSAVSIVMIRGPARIIRN
jgi:hypothetical protein